MIDPFGVKIGEIQYPNGTKIASQINNSCKQKILLLILTKTDINKSFDDVLTDI